jgi:serine/threonine protein phosphatase PrpC
MDTFTGRKDHNEDRAVGFNCQESSGGGGGGGAFELQLGKWFGVYDGHGGTEASDYVQRFLHMHVLDAWKQRGRPSYPILAKRGGGQVLEPPRARGAAAGGGGGVSSKEAEHARAVAATPGALRELMLEGFRQTEEGFLRLAEQKGLNAGSTAIAVLVHGRDPPHNPKVSAAVAAASAARARGGGGGGGADGGGGGGGDVAAPVLYTANLGDCRAVLCRGGAALRLSEDHKPDAPRERQRVERAGGCVINCGGIW